MKSIFLFLGLFFIVLFVVTITNGQSEEKIVREPAVAGVFYPDDKKALESVIDSHLEKVPYMNIKYIYGLVSPHAGYMYSGITAAYGYKQIGHKIKTVIILGPSHYKYFYGVSIPNVTHYKTPLGIVPLSKKVEAIRKESIVKTIAEAHVKEHSVEVQIPFLQRVLEDFEIVPIVVGNVNPEDLANMILKYIDDKTLVVASSDLSHYYPYEIAINLDKSCTNSIPNLNFSEMKKCEACGRVPILALMYLAKKMGWYGKLIDYRNSGDTAGNKESVVGYTSIAFYNEPLEAKEKEFLLKLARKTIIDYLNGSKVKDPQNIPESLKQISGCFVTLKKNGRLRGCIGHIYPTKPLYKCVMENAINAAVKDARFVPVSLAEMDEIEIEISVLTKPKKVDAIGEELKRILVPHRHGVVLQNGPNQATYLPQVWTDLPEKETFLKSLCVKGGMKQSCWEDKNTNVFLYEDFSFYEIKEL